MRNSLEAKIAIMKRWPSHFDPCPNCGNPKRRKSTLCQDCYKQSGRSPESKEVIFVEGEPCRKIPLTQGQYAIVDEADYEWLNKFFWHAMKYSNGYYASTKLYNPKREVKMHCMIIDIEADKKFRDHRNGDPLDNRRSNLRPCNYLQNCQNRRRQKNNTSGYHGVGWNKQEQRWQARIRVNKKSIFLGFFDDAATAGRTRDAAAIKYHGEFARLNFPTG